MKSVLFSLFVLGVCINTGCNDGPNDASKRESGEVGQMAPLKDSLEQLTSVTVEEVSKPSDKHFYESLTAFRKNDNKESAKHLREAIRSYKKEMESAKGKTREWAMSIEKKLEDLEMKIERGEVKDEQVLQRWYSSANRINHHRQFILVQDLYVPEKQQDFKSSLQKALDDLKSDVNESTGKVKTEGEEIVKKGEEMMSKLDKEARVTKKEVDDYVLKVNSWIERNLNDL
ncbi:hypothetical protein [Gynurincola endophyticus]|uniref:hypothetical protein n=1 Tax=Gynurincola endophyticus TaxID=2479004 RepID=UPI000F8CD08B|nr:hypothetical protein [Gynurincola endophyticus]